MAGGRTPHLTLRAAGSKGFGLAVDLAAHACADLAVVETYEPLGTLEPGVREFREELGRYGVDVVDVRAGGDHERATEADLVLHAGWQFLTRSEGPARSVVLHDSILPRLRGFNPTVTALILGHPELGVTAFVPTATPDAGPILSQHVVAVTHPVTIADALAALRPCYLAAALDVIAMAAVGRLEGRPQVASEATYSIWRDDLDYDLDLHADAERVVRTVLALGHPYRGASTTIGGVRVRVLGAEVVDDLEFEIRDPGKVWRVDERGPVVVCGRGMVRLTNLVGEDGADVVIDRVRVRVDPRAPRAARSGRPVEGIAEVRPRG